MGKVSATLKAAEFEPAAPRAKQAWVRQPAAKKEIVGVDVFLHAASQSADELASKPQTVNRDRLTLKMITNRGVKVWPAGFAETFCTDHWRCRFESGGAAVTHRDVAELLLALCDTGLDVIKTENLCTFDGEPGYSLGQGQ